MADPLQSVRLAQQKHLRDVQEAMVKATRQAGEVVFDAMYEETSLIDHDLAALRRMGHPYRKDDPQGVPHPDWLVHHQSGDLQETLSFRYPVVRGDEVVA